MPLNFHCWITISLLVRRMLYTHKSPAPKPRKHCLCSSMRIISDGKLLFLRYPQAMRLICGCFRSAEVAGAVALGQQVFLNNAFIAFSKNSWGWKCGHDTVHGSWYNDNRYIHPWSTDWGTCGNDCWAYFSKVRTRLQQHWTAFLPGEIFSYSMPPSTDTFRFPNPNEADVESPEIKVHGTSFKWE